MKPVWASIRYVLDKLAFAAGLFLGSQVPAFILQYRQRLGGRLDQARLDLAQFQKIADSLHGGSLDALIRHHQATSDATFLRESEVIRTSMETVRTLGEAYDALGQGLFAQIGYLARHLDADIARATLDAFAPALVLTPEALTLAFCAGLLASAVLAVVLLAGRRMFLPRRRRQW